MVQAEGLGEGGLGQDFIVDGSFVNKASRKQLKRDGAMAYFCTTGRFSPEMETQHTIALFSALNAPFILQLLSGHFPLTSWSIVCIHKTSICQALCCHGV